MSIGLKRGTVILEKHSIEWEQSAEKIIRKLKAILKEDIIDAQHIGSTSLKTINAKPIVDIVVGVTSFDRIMKHNNELSKNGIFYHRQDHPGQHLYLCGDLENDIHTHYIHVVIWEETAWNDYLNMRDYLNSNFERAKEYSDLKKELAERYAEDRITYTNKKSMFIEKVLSEARKWRNQL